MPLGYKTFCNFQQRIWIPSRRAPETIEPLSENRINKQQSFLPSCERLSLKPAWIFSHKCCTQRVFLQLNWDKIFPKTLNSSTLTSSVDAQMSVQTSRLRETFAALIALENKILNHNRKWILKWSYLKRLIANMRFDVLNELTALLKLFRTQRTLIKHRLSVCHDVLLQ